MLPQLGWNWAWQLHAIIFGKMCNVHLSFCPLLLTCFSPINLKQPHNWFPSPQCSCQTQLLISQFGMRASGCVGWLKQKIWVENTDKTSLIMEGTISTSLSLAQLSPCLFRNFKSTRYFIFFGSIHDPEPYSSKYWVLIEWNYPSYYSNSCLFSYMPNQNLLLFERRHFRYTQ